MELENKKKTILLVEDEQIVSMNESRILSRNGYNVVTVPDGESAVAYMKEGGEANLVLMDIELGGGMDGTEAARIILEDHDIPVVFLTSHTELEMVEKTEKITSYGYIIKNTGETVLLTSLKTAFRLHHAIQGGNGTVKAHAIEPSDKTERRDLEQELENTWEFLSRIINTAADPIFVKDTKHRFVLGNDTFCDFMGRKREEIIGKDDTHFFPDSEVKVFWQFDDEILATGKMKLIEESLTDSSGNTRIIMTRKTRYTDKDNQKLIVGVIRDITEQKQAQSTLEASLKENKSLLHELQHRVKNSFHIISSLIQFELNDAGDRHIKDLLFKIKNRIESIGNLYSILYVSDTIRKINLQEYIKEIVIGLRDGYLADTAPIHLNFHSDKILTDTKKAMSIGLIVNELVTNALKYAFPDDRAGEITISLVQSDDELTLKVIDDGIGISSREKDDAGSGGGSGLGLKLASMLTEQHEGLIERTSGSNGTRGTAFVIRIPVA